MSRFVNRVKKLALRAVVFTLITRALSVVRDYVWKVIQVNDEAAKAIGRLKGALLTLAQPLLSVIVPAFTALVNILTKVISVIANIVSMLFGTTAKNQKRRQKDFIKKQMLSVASVRRQKKQKGILQVLMRSTLCRVQVAVAALRLHLQIGFLPCLNSLRPTSTKQRSTSLRHTLAARF